MSAKYWDGLSWKLLSPYLIESGESSFSGSAIPTEILHNLPKKPLFAQVTPIDDPEGYLGEVWVEIDSTKIYVGNTGDYQGNFYWMAISLV